MQINTTVITRGTVAPGVVLPQLSHGNQVAQVVIGNEVLPDIDGVWTESSSLILGVTTADCAPICFSDGSRVGIAHVGWRGLAAGMIPNMLKQFSVDQLQVYVGPHLHQFEVRRDHCYDALMDACGNDFFMEQDGQITFDFTQALLSGLSGTVEVDPRNTATDLTLPSYRHGRNDERILTTVRL